MACRLCPFFIGFFMTDYTLLCGDCLEYMATMADSSIDAIVTDPPYGLRFMSKKWDYDVPTVAQWAECLRVLKPGGHLLSFGGGRTYHRMAVNVEDAGFEIRDQIMWLYGSGFPKSMDIGKQLDRLAGAEREVVGRKIDISTGKAMSAKQAAAGKNLHTGYDRPWRHDENHAERMTFVTALATPAAKQWDGWGTALKPAHEPIVLARKPVIGTIAANVLEWGTGAINIDNCRVPITDGATMARNNAPGANGWKNSSGGKNSAALNGEPTGRWPANVIHDGSDEVLVGFPVTKNGKYSEPSERLRNSFKLNPNGNIGTSNAPDNYGDTGSAARFFYCAKASRSERTCNGKVDNSHPTVKPLELMRYLCRLITPPDGLVLDPFMGSGSTGIAALYEGLRFVGIEQDEHSYDTARARIELAAMQPALLEVA